MKIFRNLIKVDGAKKSPIEQCIAIKLVIVLEYFLRKYSLAKKKGKSIKPIRSHEKEWNRKKNSVEVGIIYILNAIRQRPVVKIGKH